MKAYCASCCLPEQHFLGCQNAWSQFWIIGVSILGGGGIFVLFPQWKTHILFYVLASLLHNSDWENAMEERISYSSDWFSSCLSLASLSMWKRNAINEISLSCLYWPYEQKELKVNLRCCVCLIARMVMMSEDKECNQGGDSFKGKMKYSHFDYWIGHCNEASK